MVDPAAPDVHTCRREVLSPEVCQDVYLFLIGQGQKFKDLSACLFKQLANVVLGHFLGIQKWTWSESFNLTSIYVKLASNLGQNHGSILFFRWDEHKPAQVTKGVRERAIW